MNENNGSNSPTSAIVSSVEGLVNVSDLNRSLAFYRDVLQFDRAEVVEDWTRPGGVEVFRGPARVHLHVDRDATPAILFFQTDDLLAVRSAIKARGGMPSEIQRVNWVNLDMFEVRDPDGNTLWFGKPISQPVAGDPSKLRSLLRQALPELPLNDLPAGIEHYQEVFGFRAFYANDSVGVMYRDKVSLVLAARSASHTGIGSAYVYAENVDELYAELKAKGANLLGEPVDRPWGVRDFAVSDLEGNQIRFGQRVEQPQAAQIKIVSRHT